MKLYDEVQHALVKLMRFSRPVFHHQAAFVMHKKGAITDVL